MSTAERIVLCCRVWRQLGNSGADVEPGEHFHVCALPLNHPPPLHACNCGATRRLLPHPNLRTVP